MKKRIRASIVCVHRNSILVFKAIDPTSGKNYVFLPGGGIEQDEAPWVCAEREAREETGYLIQAQQNTELQKAYNFNWDGHDYECTTFFYKGILTEAYREPMPVKDAVLKLAHDL